MSVKEKSNIFPFSVLKPVLRCQRKILYKMHYTLDSFKEIGFRTRRQSSSQSLQNQGHTKNILNHKPSIPQSLNTYGLVYSVHYILCTLPFF